MTNRSKGAAGPTRRAALSGLVGGAGSLLAAGCTPMDTTSVRRPSTSPTASATGAAGGATPGVMTLFKDPAYNFNGLLALGASGQGAAEVGEVLTAVNTINEAGLSAQTYVETFRKLGDRLMKAPEGGRPGTGTTRFRALRAAQYYGQALFFVLGSDNPGNEEELYKAGRGAWDTFCKLSDPAPVTANVPYQKTPLPVWFFRPDDSNTRRPTVILTNGSDGQNVDMWTYGVAAALERGWNALVYDGPGQGQLLFVDRVVFTPRWETVVTPLVDWLVARSDVDTGRIALTGLSMGGDLAPRAAAFENRIAALVAMPGVLSPWRGFPPEIREILTPDKEETNNVWNKEVVPQLSATDAATMKKRFEPFSAAAMLAARDGGMFTDFYTPAKLIESLDITDVVGRIKVPTLVLDYDAEQFYPGQPRQMVDKLTSPKNYVKLTAASGAQLHCSPMAPQQHCEVVFDWLQETLPVR
ncbi:MULTISPECIES: alpha/beta hydrolase family protein [Streptomyces]|uniref:Alpha/beta hydrolase n=1 Tax=Streptomyces dengpaensis TaxID=2049881 RepID=A0ABM6SMF3_9ACTN|nr:MULTISPECIES: alpha/beta hydrolase [Streptomyces]AVH55857.1 alpha/beta hydrolase [Streptomyces dengpaensis]PIB12109.1 alpha/beta hydrolase [Streptomyces sp. HG99]